jgi:hypothetical protein
MAVWLVTLMSESLSLSRPRITRHNMWWSTPALQRRLHEEVAILASHSNEVWSWPRQLYRLLEAFHPLESAPGPIALRSNWAVCFNIDCLKSSRLRLSFHASWQIRGWWSLGEFSPILLGLTVPQSLWNCVSLFVFVKCCTLARSPTVCSHSYVMNINLNHKKHSECTRSAVSKSPQ